MKNFKKQKKGVTLIALVVTIIVLLILAVVSFRIITGDDGIMSKAVTSAEQHRIAAAKELLDLKMGQITADAYEEGLKKPDLKYIYDKLKATGEFTIIKVHKPEANLGDNVVEPDDFSTVDYILVTSKEYPDVTMKIDNELKTVAKSIGNKLVEPDKEAPEIKLVGTTSNSISFKVSDDSGIVAYAITTSNTVEDGDWKEFPEGIDTITQTGLPSGTYYIWAKDAEGNVTNVGKTAATEEVTDITDSNVTWSTSSWNGATATVSFNNSTDYQIAVSTNEDFTNPLSVSNNTASVPSGTTIYVRLTDGTNNSTSYRSETIVRPGTVTYMMNNGTQNSFKVQNASHNDTVNVWFETKPSRTNYIFKGWATTNNATTPTYTENGTKTFPMGTTDVTLYAVWELNTVTVTFKKNDGTTTQTTQTITKNVATVLTANSFTRTNFDFDGWTTNSDGTGTSYTNSQSVTLTSDLTLYAKWKRQTVTVTFYKNDGTNTKTTQTINKGVATALTANSFSRTNYTFGGWNTNSSGTGTSYTNGQSVTLTSNLTLYAKWNKERYYLYNRGVNNVGLVQAFNNAGCSSVFGSNKLILNLTDSVTNCTNYTSFATTANFNLSGYQTFNVVMKVTSSSNSNFGYQVSFDSSGYPMTMLRQGSSVDSKEVKSTANLDSSKNYTYFRFGGWTAPYEYASAKNWGVADPYTGSSTTEIYEVYLEK